MKRYEQRLAQKYGPPKKRLAVKDIEAVMVSVAAGDYVLYTDALAAVSAARADALRWVLEKMEHQYPSLSLNIHQANGIRKERARLRAIIEKELEK